MIKATELDIDSVCVQIKTKTCTRCKKRRRVEQFYKDKHVKDGLSSWCEACAKDYDRAYRERKSAEVKA